MISDKCIEWSYIEAPQDDPYRFVLMYLNKTGQVEPYRSESYRTAQEAHRRASAQVKHGFRVEVYYEIGYSICTKHEDPNDD